MAGKNSGIVYVMWNELFPEMVKIGVTTGSKPKDVEKRRRELSNHENMPQPFEAKYAIYVNNYKQIEHLIHKALTKLRHTPKREFFKIDVEDAISYLRGFVISGSAVEVKIENKFVADEQKAKRKLKRQRDTITFKSLNLPVGTLLHFVGDPSLTVRTANSSRIVKLPNGEENTISIAARKYRNKTNPKNGVKGLPDGAMDFAYRGKRLWDMALANERAKD